MLSTTKASWREPPSQRLQVSTTILNCGKLRPMLSVTPVRRQRRKRSPLVPPARPAIAADIVNGQLVLLNVVSSEIARGSLSRMASNT